MASQNRGCKDVTDGGRINLRHLRPFPKQWQIQRSVKDEGLGGQFDWRPGLMEQVTCALKVK